MTDREEFYQMYKGFETEVLQKEYKRLEDRVGDVIVDQLRRVIEDILNSRGKTP